MKHLRNRTTSRLPAVAIAAMIGIGSLLAAARGNAAGTTRVASARLADGTYDGRREYAYYGYVKVQAVIKDGKLTDVRMWEYPNDNGRSHYINSIALPYLIQEAVDAQSWKVDLISGATFTSAAFEKSLQAALSRAGA
jgi:uncharacterized protein with FMN-binding domain